MIIDWHTITFQELARFWQVFIGFVSKFIGAVIVFLIGWCISVLIGKLVAGFLKGAKFNKIFEKGTWKEALKKAELKVDASGFVGAIFKWVLMIVFLLAAVNILELRQLAEFLEKVLSYLPNVIVVALIFVVAVIIADTLEKVIRSTVEATKIGYGSLVGAIVKWSVWIFSIFAILVQLKIASELLQTLFTGLVALIAIAGGIAFGLGGKGIAAELLEALKKKLKE